MNQGVEHVGGQGSGTRERGASGVNKGVEQVGGQRRRARGMNKWVNKGEERETEKQGSGRRAGQET